jgi:hypothetical protein
MFPYRQSREADCVTRAEYNGNDNSCKKLRQYSGTQQYHRRPDSRIFSYIYIYGVNISVHNNIIIILAPTFFIHIYVCVCVLLSSIRRLLMTKFNSKFFIVCSLQKVQNFKAQWAVSVRSYI